jgi:demethylmenaquinone methyltransferase/2-methoxy-6-polyprenyl-1,4-benzoquinol methylase
MRHYYDARAAEYDEWYLGAGLYEGRHRPGWDEDLAALVAMLKALAPVRTLDVACGTAFLTRHLPGYVVALDQSAAMVEIAQARLADGLALRGDAYHLPFADGSFDRVLAGHFFGHLDAEERERFLTEARRVAPEVLVVDSAGVDREEWQERELNDGTRHRVYKRWFTPERLVEELGGGEVLHAGRWLVAVASREAPDFDRRSPR